MALSHSIQRWLGVSVAQRKPANRTRSCRPTLESLERRDLLSGTLLAPHVSHPTAPLVASPAAAGHDVHVPRHHLSRHGFHASPPAAPSFTATAVSGTEIDLSWNRVSGASGYLVDVWANGAWRQIGKLGSRSSGASVTGLSPGSTYYFDVAAYNASGRTWAPYQSATTTRAGSGTLDYPAAGEDYRPVSGSLFGSNGPSFLDVQQGTVGDCWLLSSLAAVAARVPADIQNMFTYDGSTSVNGSAVDLYEVRLYDTSGTPHNIQVDTELPGGGDEYDHPANGVLWVALAEKAYAIANGQGLVTSSNAGSDSYDALNGGWPSWALQAITGMSASDSSLNPGDIAAAWNAGQPVVIATGSNPSSPYIVGGHAYAVVGYDPSSDMPFEVYNPWGTDSTGWAPGGQVYGLFNAGADFLSQNYATEGIGSGAANVQRSADGPAAALTHKVAGDSLLLGRHVGQVVQAKRAELADAAVSGLSHRLAGDLRMLGSHDGKAGQAMSAELADLVFSVELQASLNGPRPPAWVRSPC